MERLLAESAIQRLLIDANEAEDRLDFELWKKCFAPGRKFSFDMTDHLPFMGNVEHTPESAWQQILTTIPGFTAVHHRLSPLRYDFLNDEFTKATASTSQMITYVLKTEQGVVTECITESFLIADVEVIDGKWCVTRFKVQRDVPAQNFEIFQLAGERVKAGQGRTVPLWGTF